MTHRFLKMYVFITVSTLIKADEISKISWEKFTIILIINIITIIFIINLNKIAATYTCTQRI
jgi:hypothetical protein